MNLSRATRHVMLGMALLIAASPARIASRGGEIAVADRSNANASLAAKGQFAALVWGASTKDSVTDIYAATSRDGGRTFGAPIRVNNVAGEARVAGEQPPRVALVPRAQGDSAIVVVWTAKGQTGTRLLSARSNDRGRSFAAAVPVPGSEASGNRGWESIAANRDGTIVTLWLDHRETATNKSTAAPMNHAEHQHGASTLSAADSVKRAQLSKLFAATLGEADSPRALTGGVCYCCKTALATDASGNIYAAWRHVYEGSIRDIAFTQSSDGGRTFAPPVRVSQDGWVLNACPENGPSLVVDADRRIHVVWPTLIPGPTASSEPTLGLFYAMSQDGRRFTARQRIPTEGFPRHPQITLGRRGEVVVAWDEQANGTRRIAVARGNVDASAAAQFVRTPIAHENSAAYPAVAAVEDGAIVGWTSGSSGQTVIRTERLAK
jgi:hypothetical protein